MKGNLIHLGFAAVTIVLLLLFLLTPFPHNVLSWDIFGYYLYLPLVFIYRDLGLKDFHLIETIIDTYHNTSTFYQAMPALDGQWVMKYPMGMALLYLPFFLIGHIWALASGYPVDGFSFPYQASLLYGSFVYTLIGLLFYWKSMLKFFKPTTVLLLLILIVFGTNFLVHTTFHGQGLMSHNYLFSLFSIVLWLTIKWHESPKLKYAIGLGFAIGLAALSRPTEILIAIVPVLWNTGNSEAYRKKIRLISANWHGIMFSILIVVLLGSLQLLYYKVFTGRFLHNNYGNNPGEGMEFLNPYIIEVLFSFRKGWFIYTPLMFVSMFGFPAMFHKFRNQFWAVLIFFLFSFYTIASWSCWWYADCFSQRALIPMYVFLSFPLGALIEIISEKGNRLARILFCTLLFAILLLNLFQSWQFLHGIIHTSRMTKGYYKEVLLKTKVPAEAETMLLIDRNLSPEEILKSDRKFKSRILHVNDFESDGLFADTNLIKESRGKVFEINKNNQFSPVFETTYKQLNLAEFGIIKVSVLVFPVVKMSENPFYFTATFMYNGKAYAYKGIQLTDNQLSLNTWNQLEFYYLTPEVRKDSDAFRTTFWLQGQHPVYIDDLKIEVFF